MSSSGGIKLDVAAIGDVDPSGDAGECEDTTDEAVLMFVPCADATIAPPFDEDYECFQFSDVPGVPPEYGGSTFSLSEPDLLLIGGNANTADGALYAIRVTRDAHCHITGFADASAKYVADAEYNDGGLAYAPNGTLLLARWPVNELGQLINLAVATTRVDSMADLGVTGDQGTAAIAFVPGGFPAEGAFKLMTWSGGQFYTVSLDEDGAGTYDVSDAVYHASLPGGPEGFVYISAENPQFGAPAILVSEWTAGYVAAYDIDDEANPVLSSRRDFIVDLDGAEGAHIDPAGGDFLFTTFRGGNVIVTVRGFLPNEPPPPAG
jgi:hypothetical protein